MEQNKEVKHTALLVMDIQDATMRMLPDNKALLESLEQAIKKARAHQVPVIYVIISFRKGYPEVNPDHKSFSALKNNPAFQLDSAEACRIPECIAPAEGEIIVTKKRTSAFTGSDLEVILRSMGIKHLVLTGLATSGVVLSTIREAADKDYILSVLSNACADMDEEVHRVLLTKVFPRQATVVSVQDWSL